MSHVPLSLPLAEGTRVVLAGLQPRLDAVFVDCVRAAQRVAVLWIHVVLAHQAQSAGLGGCISSTCCLLRGLAEEHGPGPLVLVQPKAHLHHQLLNGHAGRRAAGALHLLEQRHQLSFGAFWELTPKLLEDLV